MEQKIVFGVLTVSDTCYTQPEKDLSGPKLTEEIISDGRNNVTHTAIIPDEQSVIEAKLLEWCNAVDVILTTGGTGFSPRDVTPEATKAVIEKEAPGIAFAMISKSLNITDMAMLSRAVCGIRERTVIINLPGSPKGAVECYRFVKNAIPHAVAVLNNKLGAVSGLHKEMAQTDRPKSCCQHSKVKADTPAGRARESRYPMISVAEALAAIFSQCPPTQETELVEIETALNRVLAEDVHAEDALPPFPASIKDGYAVKAADGPGVRMVRQSVIAGDEPVEKPLQSGEVIRISTGAPVPEGADAVVQVEDTVLIESTADGRNELRIEIKTTPVVRQDIRAVGSDIAPGSLVLRRDDCITPEHVGVLATVGRTKVLVYRRPTVGILSTGNEVQTYREHLKPGHIRDSNKLTLINLLRQYNYDAADCGIVKDEPDLLRAALVQAFQENDLVVTTGGVSMGERDLVKQVLVEDFGATVHFGRVNMKPGKPTTFATCQFNGKPRRVFGLPGNPVSATVTSILYVIPVLRRLERKTPATFPRIKVILCEEMPLDPRPEYIRVQLTYDIKRGNFEARPTGNQISSRLNSFIGAAALAILPGKTREKAVCRKGEALEALLLDKFSIQEGVH